MAFTGLPLFPEEIQAWVRGPVVPELHRKHRRKYQVVDWPTGSPKRLSSIENSTIEWVADKYGSFSAEALSRMTHQEVPWIVARGAAADSEKSSEPISHDQMRSFYSRQCSDPEVAVAQAAASAALEGRVIDDEWQETLSAIANGARSADDVIAVEIERAKRA
ncbi:MAG TPA: type II toxin-antitoxin system antitoxin SocA domain-containing protein [Pseudonocardiaceae bacterium]|nr:type II toxin-antitoxin system antitoxin SocA domain-containing protein [Pseudonocardiaceae bacterium]